MSVLPADERFMRAALAEARAAAQAGEVPVGAVVVQDGCIVATGRNAPIDGHDPTAHAEIVALRAAAQVLGNYRLDGCTLYVTLEPCAMCSGAMLHARVGRLVYGAAEPLTGAAGSVIDLFGEPRLNHHTQVVGGVLAAECGQVLQAFFQQRRAAQRTARPAPVREDALRTPASRFDGLPPPAGYGAHALTLAAAGGGLQMHWLESERPAKGRGTFVCLHGPQGWGGTLAGWLGPLAASGARVAAPDLVGFGRSDKPKRDAWHTLEHHAALLAEGMAQRDIRHAVLMLPASQVPLALALVRCAPGRVAGCAVSTEPTGEEGAHDAPFPDAGHRAGPRAWARLAPRSAGDEAAAIATLVAQFPAAGSVVDLRTRTAAPADQARLAMEYFPAACEPAPPLAL